MQHAEGSIPWQKIGLDLFELNGQHYLFAVDYFTNFIEIDLLTSMTSSRVIALLKKKFAWFGFPNVIMSDGGPQFVSQERSGYHSCQIEVDIKLVTCVMEQPSLSCSCLAHVSWNLGQIKDKPLSILFSHSWTLRGRGICNSKTTTNNHQIIIPANNCKQWWIDNPEKESSSINAFIAA